MKGQKGSRGIALLFPQPRRQMGVGGKRHAPAALSPRSRPGTRRTGGWVGPRAGLDGCGKSRPHRDLILEPYRYTDAIPAKQITRTV
jgi:hypothetical protein